MLSLHQSKLANSFKPFLNYYIAKRNLNSFNRNVINCSILSYCKCQKVLRRYSLVNQANLTIKQFHQSNGLSS